MPGIVFDHIAIGLERIDDATAFLGELGARNLGGDRNPEFAFWQWELGGGGRLEILEAAGPAGGFMHRFIEQRGPGVHHVTFRVPDLNERCRRAEELGYAVVGHNDSDPGWAEAFLHPKQALGIVVQMVESRPEGREHSEEAVAPAPSIPPPSEPARAAHAVTLVGLRLRAQERARVHRQWGELLSGELREEGGLLVYRWPGSALRLAVGLTSGASEGPQAIELADLGMVRLPEQPVLGTRWITV